MSDLFDDVALPDVQPHPAVDMRMPETVILQIAGEDAVTLAQLGVLMKRQPHEVLLELLRRAKPSQNGGGFEATCFGCGKPIVIKRRPLPGKRNWCDSCKDNKEPAAQRARDYRDRKSQEGS